MFARPGPSSRPLLSRRSSSSPDPTEITIPSEDELSFRDETVESPKSVSGSLQRPKCPPLSIFDNYEIVSGVPTFVIESEGPFQSKYRCFAVASSGSRLAVATTPTTICVYDLLDGCSLIAKGEDLYDGNIEFLSFWDDQEDQLVVLSGTKNVVIVCISEEPCTPKYGEESYSREVKELQTEQCYDLKYSSDDDEDLGEERLKVTMQMPHDIFVCGSTMWIVEMGKNDMDSFRMTRVGKEGPQQEEILEKSLIKFTDMQLFVGEGAAIVIDTFDTTRQCESAIIWSMNGFHDKNGWRTEIIKGRCIAWDRVAKYFVTWDLEDNGTSALYLYSSCPQEGKNLMPLAYTELGKSIVGIKAAFLNREKWCFDEVGTHKVPLVCLLGIKKKERDFLVWDPTSKKILRRVDALPKKVKPIDQSKIEFTISLDGKWFAVGDWWNGTISMFSILSGVLIWSTKLGLWTSNLPQFLPFVFHSWSSKLIVNGIRKVCLFMPPCLIQDYKMNLGLVNLKLNEEIERAKTSIEEGHLRLFYKSMVSSMRFYHSTKGTIEVSEDVVVATHFSAKSVAVVIRKEQCLRIIYSYLRDICATIDENLAIDFLKGSDRKRNCIEIPMAGEFSGDSCPFSECTYLFMYSNGGRSGDHVAVLTLGEGGIVVYFGDLTTRQVDSETFKTGKVIACFQSMESSVAMCLKHQSILVMNLEERKITAEVQYSIHLSGLIDTHERERYLKYHQESRKERSKEIEAGSAKRHVSQFLTSPHITGNGNEVLLGWSIAHKKPVIVTSETSSEELAKLIATDSAIMPCWALDKTFQSFSFVEFDISSESITCFGVYNNKNRKSVNFPTEKWNGQMATLFGSMNLEDLITCDMKMCIDSRCVWIMTSAFDVSRRLEINLLPFHPYLAKDCIPNYYAFNELPRSQREDDLSRIVSRFGESIFNMPFNGKTNLHLAVEHQDVNAIDALSDCAHANGIQLAMHFYQETQTKKKLSLLEVAMIEKKEDALKAILGILRKKEVQFGTTATIFKSSFVDLWKNNRTTCEELLTKDTIEWNMFTLDIPSTILDSAACLSARVGTLEEHWVWKKTSREEPFEEDFKFCDLRVNGRSEERSNDAIIKASMNVFCLDNASEIGSEGIIRFLLSQNAPSYLFNVPLIKWIIIWKWEHIWKKRLQRKLLLFSVLLGTFTCYTLCIGYYANRLQNELHFQVILTSLLVIIVALIIKLLYEEGQQLKAYIKDGEEHFRGDSLWGLKYYFCSYWNCLELITYAIFVFLVIPLHFLSFAYTRHLPFLYTILALESLFMWLKIWYFAQGLTKTGALVLMIENVVKDCIPFLSLVSIILLGFSVAMFMLFRERLHPIHSNEPKGSDSSNDGQETFEKIVNSFDTPWKAMLTLFYAMIGAFEIEVYHDGGKLSPLIIIFFVSYLSIQAIVMFNMLIALMSDTFDRVKSTEEEQLLMGRARFIDACEAALDDEEIDEMNEGIGKYLYVLSAKDKKQSKETTIWHGRVRTIDHNVRRIVEKSHDSLMRNLEDFKEDTKALESRIEHIENDISTVIKNLNKIKEKLQIPEENEQASPLFDEQAATGSPSDI